MEIKGETEEEKSRELFKLKEGNISLVLSSYNDLFSDFDPRHYSERGISDDFLSEIKRAVREKEGVSELRLLLGVHKRNSRDEMIIKKRLKDHFRKHFKIEEQAIKKIKREGMMWFFIGSLILVVSTGLYEYKASTSSYFKFLLDFLFIISQPAGWFTFWEGLGKIFIHAKEESSNYVFYKKMLNSNIYFLNY